MANRTRTEIGKINKYEKKWKIKTNKDKFKIIPIAVRKKENVIIDGTPIEYAEKGKILGLTISRTGIGNHIKEITKKGNITLNELHIFYKTPCCKAFM